MKEKLNHNIWKLNRNVFMQFSVTCAVHSLASVLAPTAGKRDVPPENCVSEGPSRALC